MKNYIFEVTSSSKKEAIEEITNILDISKDLLNFEVVQSASKGIISGMFKKEPVTVQAYEKEEGKIKVEKIIHGILLTLLKKLEIKASVIDIGDIEDKIYVELDSEESSSIIIGKKGKNIEMLQFLINLIIPSKNRNGRRIVLDIASYKDKREITIKRMASKMADIVAKKGHTKTTDPMSPTERRILHIALEPDSRVTTKSEGSSYYKKVKIISVKKKQKQDKQKDINFVNSEE